MKMHMSFGFAELRKYILRKFKIQKPNMIENVDVNWNPEADGQRSSWQNPSSEISLTDEIYDEQPEHKDQGITKKHWKETHSGHSCFTGSCQQKFSIIKRHHHCRRCGEVFCSTCLKYQRKLNVFAHPDPQGKPYKVCQACFEEGKDSLGCVRSLTEEFKILRRVKGQELCHDYANTTSSCSEKLNIEEECQRLLTGFRKSIGTSKVKRTEMRRVIKTPEWQKSSMWMQGNTSEGCQSCRKKFSLLNKKKHCKVCGMVLCKSCSYKELLIYLPDGRDPGDTTPQLGVICFIGCPEVEPKISLLLRICSPCRDKLMNIQLAAKFLSKLFAVDKTLSDLQNKIVHQLTKENLSDCLAQYASKLQLAKGLQTEAISNKQKLLLKNFIMAKSKFYLDNMHTFHKMKAKIGDSSGLCTEDSQ